MRLLEQGMCQRGRHLRAALGRRRMLPSSVASSRVWGLGARRSAQDIERRSGPILRGAAKRAPPLKGASSCTLQIEVHP